jgi:hypothetical protein
LGWLQKLPGLFVCGNEIGRGCEELVRGIVSRAVRQRKTKERESQNYADKSEHRWKWYVALIMDRVCMAK